MGLDGIGDEGQAYGGERRARARGIKASSYILKPLIEKIQINVLAGGERNIYIRHITVLDSV